MEVRLGSARPKGKGTRKGRYEVWSQPLHNRLREAFQPRRFPGGSEMGALSNDNYTILIHTRSATERYYRDERGWVKESTRGRVFRATAEQVLNHLLPALVQLKPVTVEVEYNHAGTHHSRRC